MKTHAIGLIPLLITLAGTAGYGSDHHVAAALRSHTEAAQAEAKLHLSPEQQAKFEQRIGAIETRAREWDRMATQHPGEPVWTRLASECRAAVKSLRASPIRQDDMSTWWTNASGMAAYTGGTYYFNRSDLDGLAPPYKPTPAELAQYERKVAGFESFMLHEYLHAQQSWLTKLEVGFGRGEPEAYKAQYRYLVACGVPDSEFAMQNTLGQLVAYGVIKSTSDRAALNQELGLEGIVARQQPSPKPVVFTLEAPPSPTSQPPDAARTEIERWQQRCLAELQRLMDTDPEREANKQECLALWGTELTLACPKCGQVRTWWWMENSWCSPCCEVWLYPINRKRADGKTYTEFAAERKKIYEDRMREIDAQAADLLQRIR